jgi:Type VI secretion system (T6SS), amidase effector protein 4
MNPSDSTISFAGLPGFSKLKDEYPDYVRYSSQQVLEKIGGKVKENNFENTCAVRLSRTLNYNALKLPPPSQAGSMKVVSGADGNWYAFRVSELHDWLLKTIGNPVFDLPKESDTSFDKNRISQLTGIIMFKIAFRDATGHLDLWDGRSFTSEQAQIARDYWSKATRISVWATQ